MHYLKIELNLKKSIFSVDYLILKNYLCTLKKA